MAPSGDIHPAAFMAEATQVADEWEADFPAEAVIAHGAVEAITMVEAMAGHTYHPHHEDPAEAADAAVVPWVAVHHC